MSRHRRGSHPNEFKQRRIQYLRNQISALQSELAALVKEGKDLRKAELAATVAAPLPRRGLAKASRPPP